MRRFLITAALPYANGPVHIGHLAGCYLPSDIYARYLRMRGEEVLFVCGTDEHGVAITIKAKKEGISPREVVDKYYWMISSAFEKFGISFDHFSRTSREIHHETSQEFFLQLYNEGVFEEIENEQYYDEKADQFLADRYIMGTCPVCGSENAYGDQCEKCGSSLNPLDLINPRSTLSDAKPVLRVTRNWFLSLDRIANSEEFKHYAERVQSWKTNVKGQFHSWLHQGLQPRAMTRDLDWGVDVPLEKAKGKKLYVWFDAPIGYISATREYFLQKAEGIEDPGEKEKMEKRWELYWKDEETELLHFIGKDNIVFHTIIFPMMLMVHGDYILPCNVPANEFLNLEGQKLSTSRNWAVWLHEYLEDFPGREDELRYVLTAISPETKDSDFSWKDYQTRVNSELVAILGNYVNRVMVLSHKYFEGFVPDWRHAGSAFTDNLTAANGVFNAELAENIQRLEDFMSQFRFRDAQAEMINIARLGNKYLAETEPWKLWKTNPDAVRGILYDALNLCYRLAVACEPFLPHTSANIRRQLNLDYERETNHWGLIRDRNSPAPGHKLGEPFLLFTNVEDEQILAQMNKLKPLEDIKSTNSFAPLKETISYEDFAKLDIRTGRIIEAEKVQGADKLLKLLIDTGSEKRTVVSGIAMHYDPKEIVGKEVTILLNLAPRKLRGIESQGMILMAESGGKLHFVTTPHPTEPGSVIS